MNEEATGERVRIAELERRIAMLEAQLGRRRTGVYDREDFLTRAFEDAPIGMALVGLNERILEANASLCHMLGYTRDELLTKTVPDITHPDDANVEAQPKGAMKDGVALSFVVEKRYVRSDGSVLTGRLSVSALYDEHARPAYFLGQLEDVTREREAELARLMHETQFRALFDHAPDALLLFGADGQLSRVNGLAERLLHSEGGVVPVQIEKAVRAVMAQPALARLGALEHLVSELGSETVESEARFGPIPLLDGEGVLVALRDITERRRAERALEAALSDVSRTLAEREVLLKEVHHRVKNNLQVISSLLDMQADSSDDTTRHALRDSVHRVRSMALIHQMLYSGDDLSNVDLGDYARALATQLKGALDAHSRLEMCTEHIDISVEDAIACGLIMNELVTNALKHGRSADGHCHLGVALTRDGELVKLSVSDEGPGLPADFETRQRGSLGMQVVRALVKQLGGKLTHMSRTGGAGTRFELAFRDPSAKAPSA